MSLAFLFHYLMLNMFRMLIHPSSGAGDLFVELFHGLYCSGSMRVGVMLWFGWGGVASGCRLQLLRMVVLTSETCWASNNEIKKKWHEVGLSLFNYQDDALSNKHKIHTHLSPTLTPILLFAPLQLSSQKECFQVEKNTGGPFVPPCPSLPKLHLWVKTMMNSRVYRRQVMFLLAE